jgi:diaminohydroxyphosphoribosylaminopyrimidine deaminase/5-amino-6-(5-phosphoribosylamino)uracil reductase
MPNFSAADERFMRRALALAARGAGRVEPNPMVGCVLVRGGRVIGEGWHRRFGGPHAEVHALRSATADPRGCTAYVTLEPCDHFGQTPPCTAALIAAGVGRVVVAIRDPNPRVHGRGLAALRKHGIAVREGLLAAEATALAAPFLKLVRTGRPWVTLKWGQSLDGKLATRGGDAQWITDEVQRRHANRERGRFDAILVGVTTVLMDDPSLTCRSGRPQRVATRVVLDSTLRTPLTAKLVRTAKRTPTWIFGARGAAQRRRARLESAGCRVETVPSRPARGAGLDLDAVLRALGSARMTNVLVEGGGRLLGAFQDARLADELHVYVAPLLIGGRDAVGALHGLGPEMLSGAWRPRFETRRLGAGWLLRARLTTPRA